MKKQLKIVCLIPCLNEEKTLGKVIRDLKKNISGIQIHVFDNNSDDNSLNVARKNGVFTHVVMEKGKGNVVRRMFADVEGDIFIMVDADDTYELIQLKTMIDNLINEDLDMIVAKRISIEPEAYRIGHRLGNKVFTNIVKLTFGHAINDLFSGLRVFSRRFVKSFPANSRGFEVETELTIHALEQRLPISEIECKYKARPEGSISKLSTFTDGLRILNVIFILIKDEKPLMFFSSLSFFFIIFSLYLGVPIIFDFFETGLVEKMPSAVLAGLNMIIAFLCFFSGLVLDIIKKSRHERKRLNYLMIKK